MTNKKVVPRRSEVKEIRAIVDILEKEFHGHKRLEVEQGDFFGICTDLVNARLFTPENKNVNAAFILGYLITKGRKPWNMTDKSVFLDRVASEKKMFSTRYRVEKYNDCASDIYTFIEAMDLGTETANRIMSILFIGKVAGSAVSSLVPRIKQEVSNPRQAMNNIQTSPEIKQFVKESSSGVAIKAPTYVDIDNIKINKNNKLFEDILTRQEERKAIKLQIEKLKIDSDRLERRLFAAGEELSNLIKVARFIGNTTGQQVLPMDEILQAADGPTIQ